jgi:glycosyltransferase involved in cell wall biosynthesis
MDHGIDEIAKLSTGDRAATRSALGYLDGDKVVLFLGWVRRYKGLDLLIEAFRTLPENFRLLVAGNCIDSEYEVQLRKLLVEPVFAGRVIWEFGYLPEERISAVLCAADVLVMPYRQVDQSGVLFAALRHGIPVVAFDVGSFSEYLREGTGRIVPRGDIKGLRCAIEDVALLNWSRVSIQAVALRYRWEDTVKPVLRFYS